ncbi:flagellar basal body-associated protein FliL [Pseudomonas sp. 5P_3.1_Bac2]|uniref:flagellar basal body-associated protein FliL n=1 Tax=Pseudomonas sp. 5P_3.1_Bac2 TaxID=2971617 RepID=UPI0021C8CB7A|nr:flagellar basal body-associated protein FliL [Pseudomonas sp. 5P_3.1_Bac2]MCU1715952.1 flagellar basal body-associated protein FliL [Pseudomonas sp. 5P_3.1_Bac2]
MAKNDAAPAASAGEGKPAGRMKLIILIALAVIAAVGLSVGGTWFFLSKQHASSVEAAPEAAAPAVPVKLPALYEELAPAFVVNFNQQGRARYMQVNVALMARDQAQLDALKVHMPVLRNRLVMLFSSADFAALMTPAGKEALRQQATASVQELAVKETGKPTVEQVLFTNIVLQ